MQSAVWASSPKLIMMRRRINRHKDSACVLLACSTTHGTPHIKILCTPTTIQTTEYTIEIDIQTIKRARRGRSLQLTVDIIRRGLLSAKRRACDGAAGATKRGQRLQSRMLLWRH